MNHLMGPTILTENTENMDSLMGNMGHTDLMGNMDQKICMNHIIMIMGKEM